MDFTCNQLMVLLDIYRGTFESTRHLGTVKADVSVLYEEGYISSKTGVGYLLPKGKAEVERVLYKSNNLHKNAIDSSVDVFEADIKYLVRDINQGLACRGKNANAIIGIIQKNPSEVIVLIK
jgi:hypothetical protein